MYPTNNENYKNTTDILNNTQHRPVQDYGGNHKPNIRKLTLDQPNPNDDTITREKGRDSDRKKNWEQGTAETDQPLS